MGGRKGRKERIKKDQMVMIPCMYHQEISGEDIPNPKEMIVKLVIKNKKITRGREGLGNSTEGI